MKVYITKYALSRGIIETDAVECESFPDMIETKDFGYFQGSDWHRTMEAAVAMAEEMRLKKIESLKKQIEKLEGMKFQ